MKTVILSFVALVMGMYAFAQLPTAGAAASKIGKLTVTAFNNINAKGTRMGSAITPTKTALSAADKQMILQIAAGGQRQLVLSQALLDKVTDPQIKLLVKSEIEEQTGVAAKLQKFATAKGLVLPSGPDSSAQNLMVQVQNLFGAEADAFYLNECGIRGHELLQKTMLNVSTNAKDATLKKLAAVTLPVIRTHLTVSRDVKMMMGTTGSNASK